MIVTLVMEQYGLLTNGTTATARYFANYLRTQGHTVRIVTCVTNPDEENIYKVRERTFLFFKGIINANGMMLAKPDRDVLTEAIRGADVVHFFLPFSLMRIGKPIADKLGVAATAAFHVQPENVTYNIGLGKCKLLNNYLYNTWRKLFNRFDHVHVPSKMIQDILHERGYTSQIHAISNGVNPAFQKKEVIRPKEYEGKYLLVMSGRFGGEKMQDVLIRAAKKSKYADRIHVILCGKGPCEKRLKKIAKKIGASVEFKFCTRDELIDVINYSDLYVHTSEIESEAIACMEAFSCGKVPVISDSKWSATKQFALHPQNLFQNRNSQDLADKIDWFIENPDQKAVMEQEYLEYAKNFRLEVCVRQIEAMLMQAVAETQAKQGKSVPVTAN